MKFHRRRRKGHRSDDQRPVYQKATTALNRAPQLDAQSVATNGFQNTVLSLQNTVGNRATQRLLQRTPDISSAPSGRIQREGERGIETTVMSFKDSLLFFKQLEQKGGPHPVKGKPEAPPAPPPAPKSPFG